MRIGVCAAAVLCAAAVAAPARAQNQFATALGGPAPSAIQFKPIDMSNLVVAAPAQQNRFSFSSIFRRLPVIGTPTTGVSALPGPGTFPSTKYINSKMVGAPPYQLGDPRAAKHPFQPVLPILNP